MLQLYGCHKWKTLSLPFLLVRVGAVVRICGFCDVLRRLRWNMECLESLWAAAA